MTTEPRYPLRFADVFGARMAYVEVGDGDPIVFVHGNPTSSYMWRNVMPYLENAGRLIAPDLIGMGRSAKLMDSGPHRYTFAEHRRYLDQLLSQLGVEERVTLVLHDWGCALGFDWANRHPQAVKGIAYMEALVEPLTWADFPEEHREAFAALRSAAGDRMILIENMMVEDVIPLLVQRKLSEAEFNHYRQPFIQEGEARRPTLTWAREVPIEGEPINVAEIVSAYGKWLATSKVPKLFINGDPGDVLTGAHREFCRTWLNQTEVSVPGLHFLHEDSPDAIGRALLTWYGAL